METQAKKRLSAKQTRILKLALDAVMLILLVLMYRKQVISIAFHEIGGLALIGLFVIHHLVNAKWIGATTRRLFAKSTPGLVRARYIVDALLLLAFLAIGITGIFISKVVFSFHVQGNFKTLHYFASALAIILMGVHLGLHADYIFGKLIKQGANKVAKIALCVVLAAMVAFGGYSLFTTSFISFLAAPLQSASLSHGQFQPSGDIALDGSSGERPSDLSELPEFANDSGTQSTSGTDNAAQAPTDTENGTQQPADGESDMQPPTGDENNTPPSQDSSQSAQAPQGDTDGAFGAGGGMGQGNGQGDGEGRPEGSGAGGSTNAFMLIAQYVSIITLFAAATYGIVKLIGKRKKPIVDAELGEIIVIEPEEEQLTDGGEKPQE